MFFNIKRITSSQPRLRLLAGASAFVLAAGSIEAIDGRDIEFVEGESVVLPQLVVTHVGIFI